MEWQLNKNRPICPQICEQICVQIAKGRFKPNERLLSVREVALSAGVNPNTVQHSFNELEQQGILYSIRGSGWFVSEDITLAQNALRRLQAEKTKLYFSEMEALGLDADAIKKYIEEWKL